MLRPHLFVLGIAFVVLTSGHYAAVSHRSAEATLRDEGAEAASALEEARRIVGTYRASAIDREDPYVISSSGAGLTIGSALDGPQMPLVREGRGRFRTLVDGRPARIVFATDESAAQFDLTLEGTSPVRFRRTNEVPTGHWSNPQWIRISTDD